MKRITQMLQLAVAATSVLFLANCAHHGSKCEADCKCPPGKCAESAKCKGCKGAKHKNAPTCRKQDCSR